jgi:hypothetical protein
MALHLVRLSLAQRRQRQGPSPRHAQAVCSELEVHRRAPLAGTVDGKRQQMGIVNFDDRFGAASSADRLASSDPSATFADLDPQPQSRLSVGCGAKRARGDHARLMLALLY